jgi:hypothetical protein
MNAAARLRVALMALNALGLALYLYWLATRSERLFYHADGVLYLLPCLPFVFVFVYLRPRPDPNPDRED